MLCTTGGVKEKPWGDHGKVETLFLHISFLCMATYGKYANENGYARAAGEEGCLLFPELLNIFGTSFQ